MLGQGRRALQECMGKTLARAKACINCGGECPPPQKGVEEGPSTTGLMPYRKTKGLSQDTTAVFFSFQPQAHTPALVHASAVACLGRCH
eukprot:4417902-Lingulodinium_polyedra.AAC.1